MTWDFNTALGDTIREKYADSLEFEVIYIQINGEWIAWSEYQARNRKNYWLNGEKWATKLPTTSENKVKSQESTKRK